MASSGAGRPNYSRRFFWFALAIVLAVVLYSFGWHYASGRLVDEVNATVAGVNRDGRRASCENAEARGYPFRIGVFCRSVMFEDGRNGIGFRARQFRSAAQIYAPKHIIGELDGPATLQVPGLNALDLTWSSLQASVRLASPLPERMSMESRDLVVRLDEPGDLSPLLGQAESFQLHMRPAGADLDLAARFSSLLLDAELVGATTLPPLDGLVDLSLAGWAEPIEDRRSLRGRSGTIRNITLSTPEGAGVTITGPVAIDEAGLVDAELSVTVREPQALASILAELMPESRSEIELAMTGLSAMGDTPTLPLRIDGGEVRLGFLSLGSIPPL
ncbi:MAG: DUF2125 domain-containing protein [Mesorhizobium sp.]|nr:DUF2125 domain-containing protein [Mesorhizobium sp.]